jgi:hypothetical protein
MTRFGRKAQTLSTNIQCAFGRMKIRIIEGKKMINQKMPQVITMNLVKNAEKH